MSAGVIYGSVHDFIRSYRSSPDCKAESDQDAAVAEADNDDDDVVVLETSG